MVDYPSTSPWALSVGGAAFYATSQPVVDPAGDYVHEEVWNDGPGDASAGGPSSIFLAPTWQSGITGSQYRVTPDVSFHGYGSCYIYDSYDYPSNPWSENGGTSVAAPSWAALITIANQGAQIGGNSSLGHGAILDLYATYQNSNWYATAFHDVVAGNNNYYSATTGYDYASGLGTPHADAIAEWLGQDVPAPTLVSPPSSVLTATSATFNWGAVNDAISYRVLLTDNTTGGSVTLSTGAITTQLSTSASGLISGHSYTFSVWSQFPNLSNPGTGGVNLESSPVAVSTTFTVVTSLTAPTLSWPVNNSSNPTVVTLTPTASWSAVAGATGYYLDLVDQTTGQTVLSSAAVSGTSYTPSTSLTAGDTYAWRVMAYNNSASLQGPWSDYAYTLPEAFIPVLSIGNVTLAEGNSGTTTFNFTVSISGTNTLPTSVNFATADGTATAASGDYVAQSGTLTWNPGDNAAKTISVTVNGDTTVEPDETFYVYLSSPSNATISNSRGVGTIVNDDLSVYSPVVAEATYTNGTLESNENLRITWAISSAYSLASQTVTVDGKAITPISGPYSSIYYSCMIGTWAAGNHSYAIQSTDSKGVTGTATGTFTVVAPPNSSPVIGQVVVSQAKGIITWNVLDADGVASSTVTIDGKTASAIYGPYQSSSGLNYAAPLGSLAGGQHSYTITATDKLGNHSSTTASFTVVSSGPTISQMAVSETTDVITWNVFDADGVAGSSVAIDGKTAAYIGGPYAASSGVNYYAPLGSLAAGQHTATLTATDKQGNVSTQNWNFTLANPTGPLISQVAVSQAKAFISWNCFDAQGVKSSSIQIDGKAAANVYGPYKASSGVNFSATLSSMAAGTHTYTITATDGAGNVSTLTGSFTWGSSSAQSALASAALANLSNSAKLDWLYDFDGLA